MNLTQSTWIGISAVVGLLVTVLFLGVRVWNGDEYERVGPLLKTGNAWILVALSAFIALGLGTALYFFLASGGGG